MLEHWNRFRWDQARSTSLHDDLAEFLGDDFRPYFDSSRALAQEWDIANPRTDVEIRDFFRASTSYLYNLVIWEASGNRPDYLTAALPILHRFQPRNIVITDLDQELGPLLCTARLVICEHLAAGRAHGRQRFHHRRTPEQITGIFSRHGFARAEQPGEARSAPITVWRDVRPSTAARAALLSNSAHAHGEYPWSGRPCPATQRLRPGLGAQRLW